jgi:hypothetical protein
VHDYRRAHGLRNRNQPVPDLARDGDWLEAPLWAWRAGQGQRGRLMVRRADDGLRLRVSGEEWPTLPHAGDAGRLVAALAGLEGQGLKLRFRALTNTLFARLFVCDLFLHGIGGGKYDELTDAIVRRYYGAEPPHYLVLSGTLLLPLPSYPTTADDCRKLSRLRRDLEHNPQRFLRPGAGLDPITADLLRQKEERIARRPADATGKKRRWRVLRSLNEQLRPALEERRQRAAEQLAACRRQLRANAVLRRRDYAFCLHPEAELRAFCTRMLAP